MQSLILFAFLIILNSSTYACPTGIPEGFIEGRHANGQHFFTNQKQTAVIGIKCVPLSKEESYKSLQFFKKRFILNETTSYFLLNESSNSISRIYFKVTNNELIQATLIAKYNSVNDKKELEERILNYIQIKP